jgi:hypothetical protein
LSGHAIGQSRSGVQRVAHCVILNDAIDSAWVGVVYSGYIVHTHRAAQSMSQRVERLTMREINFFRVEKAVYALLVIGTWGRVNLYWLVFSGLGFAGSGLLHPQGNTLTAVILMHLYSFHVILCCGYQIWHF